MSGSLGFDKNGPAQRGERWRQRLGERRYALVASPPSLMVGLELECDSDRKAAGRLLTRLLAAGLPVPEFRPIEPDLEQAYLRSGIAQVD